MWAVGWGGCSLQAFERVRNRSEDVGQYFQKHLFGFGQSRCASAVLRCCGVADVVNRVRWSITFIVQECDFNSGFSRSGFVQSACTALRGWQSCPALEVGLLLSGEASAFPR